MEYIEIVKEQLNAHKNNRSYALVTIIGTDGATTRKNGRMLVYGTGERLGTIGGGAIEALAVRDAVKAALSGESGLFSYDLNTEASAAGLACGGAMQVWIDAVPARPVLVMCGGGHVGMAVMPLARSVGFEVILVDKRPKVELGSAIGMADRFFRADDMEKGLLELELPAGAYYVIAGPNHDADGAALAGALKKDGAYVGMIGGPPKINAIFAKLKAKGFSEGELAAVHTPIGLDISNERPEEIAVAILAEILMVKNGKGRPAGL